MDLTPWSARRLVQAVVTSRGIALGRPVDVLFDAQLEYALGLDVFCVDRLYRFLPWLACRPSPQSIEVRNPLSLLGNGEADFYRRTGISLRDLRTPNGARVEDVDLDEDGRAVVVHLKPSGRMSVATP